MLGKVVQCFTFAWRIMRYNVKQGVEGPMAKTDTQIGIRVTEDFKKRLEHQAELEHRTVSNLITKVLSEYLEQRENAENEALCI